MGKKNKKDTSRVEFGNEFLDMNASKIYDVTNHAKKKEKRNGDKG